MRRKSSTADRQLRLIGFGIILSRHSKLEPAECMSYAWPEENG